MSTPAKRDGYLDYQQALIQARREALWRQLERFKKEQHDEREESARMLGETGRRVEFPWMAVTTILLLAACFGLGLVVGQVVALCW